MGCTSLGLGFEAFRQSREDGLRARIIIIRLVRLDCYELTVHIQVADQHHLSLQRAKATYPPRQDVKGKPVSYTRTQG